MTSLDRLPPLIRRYLAGVIPVPSRSPGQVRISQKGDMITKPGGKPMGFVATERFAVDHVGFVWEARVPIAGMMAIRVTDRYADGGGTLRVRALGIPLSTRSGPGIAEGEVHRYLAELPWVPHAMTANPDLEWREVDEHHVSVSTPIGSRHATVTFEFDVDGEIVYARGSARPRGVGKETVPTPWGGQFSDYETLSGLRIPTRAEAYWDLPEGRLVYWRAQTTAADVLDDPFDGR
jgi:hypothetical protein